MKKMLLAIGLAMCAGMVSAQSMSDDQVVEYVKKEQAKGQSQQQIVSKLFQKGVTTDQLRRINIWCSPSIVSSTAIMAPKVSACKN